MAQTRKKVLFWVLGTILSLLLSLAILALLSPFWINTELARALVLAQISQRLKGEVTCPKVDFYLFPRPRLVLDQLRVSVPGKGGGTVAVLTAYPRILPLFTGRAQLTRLKIERGDIAFSLPEKPSKMEGDPEVFSPPKTWEKMNHFLTRLSEEDPDLVIEVEKSKVSLFQKEKPLFRFQDIHLKLTLPPGKARLELTCESGLWKKMTFQGESDPKDFNGRILLTLTQFHPERVVDYAFPDAIFHLGPSQLDLKLDMSRTGSDQWEAALDGTIPRLALREGEKSVVIRGKTLKASMELGEAETKVHVGRLELLSPQLNGSGTLLLDRHSQAVSLDLNGKDVDIVSVRQAALSLGGHIPLIREVFLSLKGGVVSSVAYHDWGTSFTRLGRLENIRMAAELVNGEVFIPGPDLNLEKVSGDVTIAGGILQGKNLEAGLGGSKAVNGTLRWTLEGKDPPFHVETQVKADVAHLPDLMKRMVKDKTFQREMERIEFLEGHAKGTLVLGEHLDSMKVRFTAEDFNLSARYEPLPYPVRITGGRLSYAGTDLSIVGVTGRMGQSTFSKLKASLNWKKAPWLKIRSGAFTLRVEEIFQGLRFMPIERLIDVTSAQGVVNLDVLDLQGPLKRPELWRFRLKGKTENITFASDLFSGPVSVSGGEWEADPESIRLTDFQLRILDASLRLSGFLGGYLQGPQHLQEIDILLKGTLGPEALRSTAARFHFPAWLRVRPPISLTEAHLTWQEEAETALSATFRTREGPKVRMDLAFSPDEFVIKKLVIEDELSHLFLALKLRGEDLDLNFQGNLAEKTLDTLLEKNQLLSGGIRGDLSARIPMNHFARFTAQGHLQGEEIDLERMAGTPMLIKRISMEAKDRRMVIQSADILWQDIASSLSGELTFSEEAILVDLAVSVGRIDWGELQKAADQMSKTFSTQAQKSDIPPPRGEFRVRAESFRYGKWVWSPLYAKVTLAQNQIRVDVIEANLCGISIPGTVNVTPHGIRLDIKPACKDCNLEPTLLCLWDKKGLVTGLFDLSGRLTNEGKLENVKRSLQGEVTLTAHRGRLYQFGLLAKVFSLLTISDMFRGKLPDLSAEGFAYETLSARAELKGGHVLLKEGTLDSSSMDIACQGDIDLVDGKIDLNLLIAPFTTIDLILKYVPLLADIFAGHLVSVPVKVKGDLSDPTVIPLPPTAVGSELLGIMVRTLTLPVKIIQPLLPKEKPEEPKS
jgi:hypothetical protein